MGIFEDGGDDSQGDDEGWGRAKRGGTGWGCVLGVSRKTQTGSVATTLAPRCRQARSRANRPEGRRGSGTA